VDPAVAIILGVFIGGLLTWAISLFQRRADREARATERKYEQLHAVSRHLRVTLIHASFLNYSRSWFARLLDVTSWERRHWTAVAMSTAETGSSLALVIDDVAGPVLHEYETAVEVVLERKRSDAAALKRLTTATLALRRLVEARARSLR
jgi:hypothetical protein